MSYFFRDLHLSECQLDELWTFVYKKQAQLEPIEQLLNVYGDAWVWVAFSPVFKLVPAWLVGKRTLHDARKLIFRLKSATDGHIPFFTVGWIELAQRLVAEEEAAAHAGVVRDHRGEEVGRAL